MREKFSICLTLNLLLYNSYIVFYEKMRPINTALVGIENMSLTSGKPENEKSVTK
jgi:hypothetical protein